MKRREKLAAALRARQAEMWRAHLRLTLLRFLADQDHGATNDSLLTDATVSVGIDATRDQVNEELRFLKEKGCVTIEKVAPISLVTITDAGVLVATGRRRIEGIKPPSRRG